MIHFRRLIASESSVCFPFEPAWRQGARSRCKILYVINPSPKERKPATSHEASFICAVCKHSNCGYLTSTFGNVRPSYATNCNQGETANSCLSCVSFKLEVKGSRVRRSCINQTLPFAGNREHAINELACAGLCRKPSKRLSDRCISPGKRSQGAKKPSCNVTYVRYVTRRCAVRAT
jgi:hypothetical protein